ncbi:MAG TPA: hypothetical protein ENK49_14070 [Gammaproteobacteria bacterium]|nr:hypothetical protein [Gammaproteobacteria bacterium]
MNQQLVQGQIAVWLEPGRRKWSQMIHRSSRARLAALSLASIGGCLLMLSPLITLAVAAIGGVYLFQHIQGPLDWFMVEVLGAICLFSGYLSIQFYHTRPQTPQGVRVTREQSPELLTMLERRVTHFGVRAPDTLELTPDTDLKIQATPAWSVPLLHRYRLQIGAPLLYFLSPGQFRLALAGAIAASARSRHSWNGWLAQAAEDWPLIVSALEQRSSLLATLMLAPLRWISRVTLSLSAELRAERVQVQSRWVLENTDEQKAMEYLSNLVVANAFLSRQYWSMIYKAAERCPAPVVKPFSHFGLLLEKLLSERSARRWLLQAQTRSSTISDADLRDLLADLNIEHLHWSRLPEKSAFDNLFTSTDILKELDTHWQALIEPEWNRRHAAFQNDRLRFEKLQARARQQGLRGDSALRYVKLAGKFMDGEKAVAVYRTMYQANLDDANLCFTSGCEMLKSGNLREGCEALQRAAELDRSLANRAHALISEHRHAWMKENEAVVQRAG